MNSLGERIHQARKEKGLTLRELEDLCGVSNSQLSMLETGRRSGVTWRNVIRIADALSVSLDWLAGRPVWLAGREKTP